MSLLSIYAFLSVFAVSLISLVGGVVLFAGGKRLSKALPAIVALSAGALFGDVFIHMLPELFSGGAGHVGSLFVLGGILLFFALEKFLMWRHSHGHDCEEDHIDPGTPLASMVIISDGLHNFIDGAVIGVSFLVSVPVGIATTLAVVLHEIPQEIGNIALLVHSGWSSGRALLWNFISALTSFLGLFAVLVFAGPTRSLIEPLLALAAGSFIYIAGSDLVPELKRVTDPSRSSAQFIWMIVGIALMAALLLAE
jgi:zinc and cadmium transporter